MTDLKTTDVFRDQYGAAKNQKSGLTWPGIEFVPAALDDANDLPGGPPRGLYVNVSGDITCTDYKGNQVTFSAVPQGIIFPIRPVRIFATGTTADLICLY